MAEAHRQDRSVGYVKVMPSRLCSGLQKQAYQYSSTESEPEAQLCKDGGSLIGRFYMFHKGKFVSSSHSVSKSQSKKLPYF